MRTLDISTEKCPGAIVLVDDEDWDFVRRLKWTPARHRETYYAVSYGLERVYLHRQIARARVTESVDHKDGDGLNCQRSNLRLCNNTQNQHNRRKRKGKSKYKGAFPLANGKWLAYITINKRRMNLGRHATEEAAARAYDTAAVAHFGEFARTNFAGAP